MFGLSVEHFVILLVAALFILGPERLPEAASWLARSVRKARDFATGAQEQLRAEIGPELQDLRKPLQDLQGLREFNLKTALNRYLLDEDTATALARNGQSSATATRTTGSGAPLQAGERPPVDPDAT